LIGDFLKFQVKLGVIIGQKGTGVWDCIFGGDPVKELSRGIQIPAIAGVKIPWVGIDGSDIVAIKRLPNEHGAKFYLAFRKECLRNPQTN
jgi:hypothetical protein